MRVKKSKRHIQQGALPFRRPFAEFVDEHFQRARGDLVVTIALMGHLRIGQRSMARCVTVPLDEFRAGSIDCRDVAEFDALVRTLDPAADMLLCIVRPSENDHDTEELFLMRNARDESSVAERLFASAHATVH